MRSRFLSTLVSRDLARRDVALDAFRGLLILGMVLVNHPPPKLPIYAPLMHAVWHGWTLADTILPGFLFAVGVSIHMTLRDAQGVPVRADAAILTKVFRRFAILMALNFLLLNFPYFDAPWRLMSRHQFTGTLALIAWNSLVVGLIVLFTRRRTQVGLLLAALMLQWAVYALLPLPGAPAGSMAPEANAARVIDEWLFGAWGPGLPAGITCLPGLPTLGAITTTLLGALAAPLVLAPSRRRGLPQGVVAGLVLVAGGQVLGYFMPINKLLWTVPFSLLMSGIALAVFGALDAFDEARGKGWLRPLQVAGANALLLYVFSQAFQRLLVYGRVPTEDGGTVRLRYYMHEHWVAPVLHGEFGSLVFALLYLGLCYVFVWLFFRLRLFVKL